MDHVSHFDNLPAEMKLKIFSYVPHDELRTSVANTSDVWKVLAYDPHLWKRIKFTGNQSERDVKEILLRSHLATRVEFFNTHFFFWSLRNYGKTFDSVEELYFTNCHFARNKLHQFVTLFPNVKILEITNCKIGDESEVKCNRWKLLTTLVLSDMGDNYANDLLIAVAKQCLKLEKVIADNFIDITDTPFGVFTSLHHESLKVLEFSFYELEAESYKRLALCSQLVELNIEEAYFMTDHDFMYLQELKCLQRLHINHSEVLFSRDFPTLTNGLIFPELRHLRLLDCANLDDDGLQSLLRSCPQIQSMGLCSIPKITERGIQYIFIDYKTLKSLILCDIPIITEIAVRKLQESAICTHQDVADFNLPLISFMRKL